MPKVELVYFVGCPNIELAKSTILAAGFSNFSEVDLSRMSEDHPYQRYSSPTILIDGRLVAGSENGGAACSIIDWNRVEIR